MTVLSAPYTLLRRDGEARVSLGELPSRAGGYPVTPATEAAVHAERRAGLSRPEVARLIAARHFAVAFQPVVRLADRRPVSHEALLRLRPAAGAVIQPTRVFVDAARDWDLGAALDLAVLDMALATWSRDAATPISVNIDARSLRDPVFFAKLLHRAGGEAATVGVEISGLREAADLAPAAAMTAALRDAGARVVLDDFAATDLCLALMRVARFDEVKFAGALVGDAVAGPRGCKLLRALVALADAVGTRSVAKLVETEPQAALMHELGVGCGQGWLFGAPVIPAAGRPRPARAA